MRLLAPGNDDDVSRKTKVRKPKSLKETTSMKDPKKLLPAVMLSASVLSSLAGTAMATTSESLVQATNGAGAIPAVLSSRAPSDYPVPERLTQYTASMAEYTGYQPLIGDDPNARPEHCATISGSDNGWDDSDCW